MKRSLAGMAVGILLLAGCSSGGEKTEVSSATPQVPFAAPEAACQAAASDEFKDPDGVKFREVTTVGYPDSAGETNRWMVWGEANGTNDFNAYTGYRAFECEATRASATAEIVATVTVSRITLGS